MLTEPNPQPTPEQVQRAREVFDRLHAIPKHYNKLIWRMVISMAPVFFVIPLNLVVASYMDKFWVKITLYIFAGALVAVCIHGVRLIIDIVKERRRVMDFIKTGVYEIPPPK